MGTIQWGERMTCEICGGKGWIANPRAPALVDRCHLCDGRGSLSWGQAARKLDELPSTLARVRQLRSKPETCVRVLDKVCKLLWPKGQLRLFTR